MNGVPVKPGFFELSDYLKEQGIKSVIATSTSYEAALQDLKNSKIFERFDGVIGGDSTENGKPFPDPYIAAAKLAGFPVEECIAVEDSKNGITSAVAAKVRCIYIKDFLDVEPDIEELIFKKVTSLDEIIGIIKEING